MKNILAVLIIAVSFSACSGKIVAEPFEPAREWAEQGLTASYVFAKGKALMNPSIFGPDKRRTEARDAALENARANMLSLIEASYINESIPVSRLIEGDAFLESQIAAVIEQNSRTVRTEWSKTDCAVIIRLPRESLKLVGITLVR
ncbi:MAG: hypothetical protein K5838_05425 [Elusimicrobiales bacterium]|nr:hypothetical protein [Elusimicrobiales bacterium]